MCVHVCACAHKCPDIQSPMPMPMGKEVLHREPTGVVGRVDYSRARTGFTDVAACSRQVRAFSRSQQKTHRRRCVEGARTAATAAAAKAQGHGSTAREAGDLWGGPWSAAVKCGEERHDTAWHGQSTVV